MDGNGKLQQQQRNERTGHHLPADHELIAERRLQLVRRAVAPGPPYYQANQRRQHCITGISSPLRPQFVQLNCQQSA